MNKLGIEKVKVLLAFGFGLGKQLEAALSDGKITFADLPGFIAQFMSLQAVVDASKPALAEAMDLTADERTELNAWAQGEFDLTNDGLEAKVEAALDLSVSLLIAYGVFAPKK